MSIFKEVAETGKQINRVRSLTELEQSARVDLPVYDVDKMDDECRADLREIQNFYGSWEALRKVIKELEDNDNEAAWERHNNDKLK